MNARDYERKPERELQIELTKEQREQLVGFIGETQQAHLVVDVVFEADTGKAAVAPIAVLVGNAV